MSIPPRTATTTLSGAEEAGWKGRLRRLGAAAYLGRTAVHWVMPMEGRAKGWLSELHHARFREVVLHAAIRYEGACPAYCLMPDHGHLLLLGLSGHANLSATATLIRKEWNALLQPLGVTLQRQAYDHVLRPSERRRSAFQGVAHYILENPVRAGLSERPENWPYLGSLVPGYPSLDPGAAGFWRSFWLAIDDLTADEARPADG